MTTASLLGLVAVLVLASCSELAPEPELARAFGPNVTNPEISPRLASGARLTADASKQADNIRDKVRGLQKEAQDASRASQRAQSELRRLVDQKNATEADLLLLQELFTDTHARNLFLEEELASLVSDHEELKISFEEVRKVNDIIRSAGERKDAEVLDLREKLKSANDHIDKLKASYEKKLAEVKKERDDLDEAVVKLSESAGAGKAYGKQVWVVLIAVLAIIAGVIYFKRF